MAIKVGFNTTSMCVFLSANTYRLYYVRYIERMKYKYMFYNRCAYIYILYICTVYRIYICTMNQLLTSFSLVQLIDYLQ